MIFFHPLEPGYDFFFLFWKNTFERENGVKLQRMLIIIISRLVVFLSLTMQYLNFEGFNQSIKFEKSLCDRLGSSTW